MHNMHYVHCYYFTALTALCTQELLHGSYIAFTGNLVSKEQGTELFSCCLNVYAWIGVQILSLKSAVGFLCNKITTLGTLHIAYLLLMSYKLVIVVERTEAERFN